MLFLMFLVGVAVCWWSSEWYFTKRKIYYSVKTLRIDDLYIENVKIPYVKGKTPDESIQIWLRKKGLYEGSEIRSSGVYLENISSR